MSDSKEHLKPQYAIVVRNFGTTQTILYVSSVKDGIALTRNGMMFHTEIFENRSVIPRNLDNHYSSTEYYAYHQDSPDLVPIKESVDKAMRVAWFEKQKFSIEDKVKIYELFHKPKTK